MIDNLGYAGTEQWLLRLMKSLDQTKVKPFLCLLDGTTESSSSLIPPQIPTICLRIKSFASRRPIAAYFEFKKFVKSNSIKVVQLHFSSSTHFGSLCSWLAGVENIIATSRNAGYWLTSSQKFVYGITSRLCSIVVANSETSRNAALNIFRVPENKVIVIPNGVDIENYRPVSKHLPDEVRTGSCVGMVANLRPVKDVRVFVEAARIVLKQKPECQFLVAGDGPEKRILNEMIGNYGIGRQVQLLGSVTDISSFLRQIDVAVLTSRSEGCSNTVLEYFASGCPTIVSDAPGNLESATPSETAEVFRVGDPNELAIKILELLDDTARSRRLGDNGRLYVEKFRTVQREVGQYTELYQLAQAESLNGGI